MYSGIQNLFFEAFPHTNGIHSGIPPIVGIFKDNSWSTLQAFNYNGLDTVDQFVELYKNYSYQSGVFDQVEQQSASGYVNLNEGEAEELASDGVLGSGDI